MYVCDIICKLYIVYIRICMYLYMRILCILCAYVYIYILYTYARYRGLTEFHAGLQFAVLPRAYLRPSQNHFFSNVGKIYSVICNVLSLKHLKLTPLTNCKTLILSHPK